jgi:hypothetical protein
MLPRMLPGTLSARLALCALAVSFWSNLAHADDTYWSASESGARFYQRRPFGQGSDPWSHFYPFIFTFQPASMTSRTARDGDFKAEN